MSLKKLLVPIIAMLLIAAIVISLFVWPGFLKSEPTRDEEDGNPFSPIILNKRDYKVKPTVVKVGPDNYIAEVDDVIVDFGEYNDFLENKELQIKDIGEKFNEDQSLSAHIYDFELENQSKFFYPVAITLPCNGIEYPYVQYYNEDTELWEFVPSVVSEYENSVIFLTDHFSIFGVFESTKGRAAKSIFVYENLANGPETPVSKVYYNPAYTREIIDKCNADTQSLIDSLKAGSAQSSKFSKAMLDSLGSTSSATGGSDYTSKVVAFLNDIEIPDALDKSLSCAGAALTSVKVGLSWYESGSISKALQDNAFDLAEFALSSAAQVYGSAPLTVCAGAAFLAGAANELGNDVTKWINGNYDTPVEHAYGGFAEKHLGYSYSKDRFIPIDLDKIPNTATVLLTAPADSVLVSKTPSKIWGDIFRKAYLDNNGDPQKTMAAIDARINEYAVVFWGLDDNIRKIVSEDVHKAHDWKEPDHDMKVKMRDEMTAALKSKMRLLYKGLFDRFMIKAQKDCEKQMWDVARRLNKIIKVTIVVEDEDGNEIPISQSEYKNYLAAFIDPQTGEPLKKWQWNPSKSDFEFTIFNYGAVGTPTTVKLYESKSDLKSNTSDTSLFFTFQRDKDRVILKLNTTEEKQDDKDDNDDVSGDTTNKPNIAKGEGYWKFNRIVPCPDARAEYDGCSITGSNGSYTYTDRILESSHCYYVCGHDCQGEYVSFDFSHTVPKDVYLGGEEVRLNLKGTLSSCSEYWCLTANARISAKIRYRSPDNIWPSYGTDSYMESEDGIDTTVGLTGDGLTNDHHKRKPYEFDTVVTGTISAGSTPGETAYIMMDIGTPYAYVYDAYEYIWTINE